MSGCVSSCQNLYSTSGQKLDLHKSERIATISEQLDQIGTCPYLGYAPQSVLHQHVCQFLSHLQHQLCVTLILYPESVLKTKRTNFNKVSLGACT